ncbi:hypothetical protein ASE43_20115 [Lysobacter sp. Root983]|nr:hypothetical protein ASE43_20115 [Lysobacter sp. Root983]
MRDGIVATIGSVATESSEPRCAHRLGRTDIQTFATIYKPKARPCASRWELRRMIGCAGAKNIDDLGAMDGRRLDATLAG